MDFRAVCAQTLVLSPLLNIRFLAWRLKLDKSNMAVFDEDAVRRAAATDVFYLPDEPTIALRELANRFFDGRFGEVSPF